MLRLLALGTILVVLQLGLGPNARAQAPCEEWADVAGVFATSGDEGGSGIGGTGRAPTLSGGEGEGSGIGGTGREAGVFGTITGFGSVCVNGLRIHYDERAAIDVNGEPVAQERLARGQLVWIRASVDGGRLVARSISARSALAGRLDRVDVAKGLLSLAGRHVLVSPDTLLVAVDGSELSPQDLRPGQFVDVSGLEREDGTLLATRIERRERGAPAAPAPLPLSRLAAFDVDFLSIEGFVQVTSAEGRAVSGLSVESRENLPLPASGRVWVLGRTSGQGALRPARIVEPPPVEIDPDFRIEPPSIPVPRISRPETGKPPLGVSDRPDLFGRRARDAVQIAPTGPDPGPGSGPEVDVTVPEPALPGEGVPLPLPPRLPPRPTPIVPVPEPTDIRPESAPQPIQALEPSPGGR